MSELAAAMGDPLIMSFQGSRRVAAVPSPSHWLIRLRPSWHRTTRGNHHVHERSLQRGILHTRSCGVGSMKVDPEVNVVELGLHKSSPDRDDSDARKPGNRIRLRSFRKPHLLRFTECAI